MVQIAGSTFEGLFLKTLKVQGPIVQQLRRLGFDPEKMEAAYSVEVWRKSLQLAAKEYYPTLSSTDAEFQLGSRMVGGFLETIAGKVIAAALPFLSADGLCKRLPRFFSSGTIGMPPPTLTHLGERHYQVTMYGDQGVPWFTAGAVDAVMRINQVTPNIKVETVTSTSFTVGIRWNA
jgi:uncharacterized protein (TIGR02265 family)